MRRLKLFIISVVIIFSVCFVLPVRAALVGNTSQATLTASPQTGTYNVNDNFSVSIYVNTNGQNVVVVAAYLNYDTAHFDVVSIDTSSSVFTMIAEKATTTAGEIKITMGIPSSSHINSSNALVAVINFRAIGSTSPSSDNLTFQFTAGSTIESNVILDDGLGTDYLSGVYNARYTVSGTDTTPPTISAVTALSITSSGATITWTTANEASDSQVEYGLTSSYGSQTTLNTSMVTSHSQTLSGLSASTLYHYRVKSRDAAGNLATSGDYTFTTGIPSCTTLSFVSGSVSPSSVTAGGSYTVSCDYGATTNAINPVVGSGTCTFSSFLGTAARFTCTAGSTPGTFTNSCTISNMSPDYYCARTDAIASLTVTSVVDSAAPSVPSNLTATAVSSSQINLSWTASTDNVGVTGYRIYRCQGTGCTPSTQLTTTTSASYSDSGLTANTTYVFRVAAYDAAGNVSGQSSSASATTQASDTTPPNISGVTATAITSSGATITWTTANEASDSQVEYGLTSSYGSQTTLNTSMVTSHSQTLSGLSASTLYHYRVKSRDAAGNNTVSTDQTFTTLAGATVDTTSPAAITNLSTSDITQTSVRLLWSAPGDDSNVGTAKSYDLRYSTAQITRSNWSSATQVSGVVSPVAAGSPQSMIVVGLQSGTTYYFAIKTQDEAGNISDISNVVSVKTSGTATPATPPSGDTTPPQKPSNTQSFSANQQITLRWQNPTDADFVRVLIVRKEGSAPTSRTDGVIVYEGSLQEFTDTNLDNNKTYYYAIYAYDTTPNYSLAAVISAKPAAGVTQITPPATPSPSGTFTKLLYFGMTDAEVKTLQEYLARNKAIYPEGSITGYFGLLTQLAVQRFQCQYNIICSGSYLTTGYGAVGPKTRQKLNELYTAAPQTGEITQLQVLRAQVKALQDQISQLLNQIDALIQAKTQ